MLWVADGFLAIVGFGVGVVIGHTFAVTLEGAGFGAGEAIKETPFIDLVADFARDGKEIGHSDMVTLRYG